MLKITYCLPGVPYELTENMTKFSFTVPANKITISANYETIDGIISWWFANHPKERLFFKIKRIDDYVDLCVEFYCMSPKALTHLRLVYG